MILLIDSDHFFLSSHRVLFESFGRQVVVSRSAEAALRMYRTCTSQFSWIFTEARLIDGDGLALARRLREVGYLGPLVLLTSQANLSAEDALFSVDAWMNKPLKVELAKAIFAGPPNRRASE